MPEKKLGRPFSKNPKGIKITVRFDNETFEDLKSFCEEMNLSKAEALRQGFYKLKDDQKKEE